MIYLQFHEFGAKLRSELIVRNRQTENNYIIRGPNAQNVDNSPLLLELLRDVKTEATMTPDGHHDGFMARNKLHVGDLSLVVVVNREKEETRQRWLRSVGTV
ncbi:hypothetical protein F2Q69_00061309 [Brassica cretica]|uniref:Uncharacterized protein n=1 Tax=Brassica cretica TaxID=69181 RepID=A0A8S9RJ22_BRACR|nr:hypothetical protein F2Q69_00061309 [Brassica cretica]